MKELTNICRRNGEALTVICSKKLTWAMSEDGEITATYNGQSYPVEGWTGNNWIVVP